MFDSCMKTGHPERQSQEFVSIRITINSIKQRYSKERGTREWKIGPTGKYEIPRKTNFLHKLNGGMYKWLLHYLVFFSKQVSRGSFRMNFASAVLASFLSFFFFFFLHFSSYQNSDTQKPTPNT